MDDCTEEPPVELGSGELARRIMGGDRQAADEFVRRYYRWLLLIVRHKFPRQTFHLDVCQQAFLDVLLALESGSIRNPDAILSFLRSTAINIGYQHLREQNKSRSAVGQEFIDELIADLHAEIPEMVMWQQRVLQLKRCIDALSVPRDRELLGRYYLDNEGKPEICRALGLTPDHFDRVLYRAKQRLRKRLDDEEHPWEGNGTSLSQGPTGGEST